MAPLGGGIGRINHDTGHQWTAPRWIFVQNLQRSWKVFHPTLHIPQHPSAFSFPTSIGVAWRRPSCQLLGTTCIPASIGAQLFYRTGRVVCHPSLHFLRNAFLLILELAMRHGASSYWLMLEIGQEEVNSQDLALDLSPRDPTWTPGPSILYLTLGSLPSPPLSLPHDHCYHWLGKRKNKNLFTISSYTWTWTLVRSPIDLPLPVTNTMVFQVDCS